MLIGKEFEREPEMTATRMCANHLADQVRNTYLRYRSMGIREWEEAYSEAPSVIPSLQKEGFCNVTGIDYLFRWWGESGTQDLAGEIIFVWKVQDPGSNEVYYRTWLKLAERDFAIGTAGGETKKRQLFRAEFSEAFESWKSFFSQS